jgi:hypothetical protein
VDKLEEDFRTTAASIAGDADRLAKIEEEKASLDVADPRLRELSTEAIELTEQLAAKTHAEDEIVSEATGA